MRDNEKDNFKASDLSDVKKLIGDTDKSILSIDDILAEYSGRATKKTSSPSSGQQEGEKATVVAFPGVAVADREEEEEEGFPEEQEESLEEEGSQEEEEQEEEATEELEHEPEQEPDTQSQSDSDTIVSFPEEESVLSAFLKDLTRKADAYADQMYEQSEQMDSEEIERLERWIPGTDEEEEENIPAKPLFRWGRRQEELPPDLSPQELSRQYGKGLGGLRVRNLFLFFLSVLSIAQLIIPKLGYVWMEPLNQYQVQIWIATGFLSVATLLSVDLLWEGLQRTIHGRFGMDTLALCAVLCTLADSISLAFTLDREGGLPCCAVVVVALFFLSRGRYQKRSALRLNCRTAASAAEPYLVTLDEGLWNGRPAYCKHSGIPNGFGSQIQMDDGAQRIYRRVCPVLFLACILFSILASYGMERGDRLLWSLSTTFTAATAFGGTLIFGRPLFKMTKRLSPNGVSLGGWTGVAQSKHGEKVLLCDGDLFPPGYVELNGIKVFGDYSVERVIGYTATLIRDSGSGLTKLFHDLLRAQGGLFRHAEDIAFHEGGGISASIRGDDVLVGSAAFMNLMDVPLPQGLNVKNAVFCAIDGELVGIFALNYRLPDGVFPSVEGFFKEKIGIVLATRDFNLIPAMLQQRFKLATNKMDFPPIERRRELSDPDQVHNPILTGLLCREGLLPFAELVIGVKRLRWATRFGAVLSCIGSLLGILLSYYLTSVDAYGSLSTLNLMVYMLSWFAPVWFLTSWVPRY